MSRAQYFRIFLLTVFVGGLLSFAPKKKTMQKQSPPSKSQWVNSQLAKMTLDQKIGQFFMVAGYSNRGEDHLKQLDKFVEQDQVGGIIFFQGQRENLISTIERLQNKAQTPLLIGMDAEWGTQMRLFGEERFPYNYTIGAANNPELTERIASMIGQECREMGIHINFAPVADVNSNPNNPVIGFRSFGEQPVDVSRHVAASVKGLEKQGVMTSIKHFPGHGDTDTDSHLELPTINNSATHINAIDFAPFRAGIAAGTGLVMIGHLNVPALDSTGTPSSLSKTIIQDYLKGELGFKGLVISDALNMKAVSERYGKTDVVVKAFVAGCDILLFPESVTEAITAIKAEVESGNISEEEIDERCKKLLTAKYETIVSPKKVKEYNENELLLAKRQVYEQAITVLKNNEVLPIARFDRKIAHVSIGSHTYPLEQSMSIVAPVDQYHFYTVEEAQNRLGTALDDYDLVITSLHSNTVRSRNDYGLPKDWRKWTSDLKASQNVLMLFANPLSIKDEDLTKYDGVICAYENHQIALDRAGQFIMGTYASKGKLPFTINSSYKLGHGVSVPWAGRLKESMPEELGMSRSKMEQIDQIAMDGVTQGAYPGCQVVIAVEGKVIWRKSYGYHTYDKKRKVKNTDIYDIASITKVAASTASLMRLETKGEFTVNSQLKDYLPEMLEGSRYGSIRLKDMLTHQSGLVAWIPFYKKTLTSAWQPSPEWYSKTQTDEMSVRVTDDLWIKPDYTDTMYQRILRTPLKSRRYKYSDLGYYFVRKIVQAKSGQELNEFAMDELYKPMGLQYMRYLPSEHFALHQITPTEDDTIFRKQLIHGHVHDPGAAMIGGVGGHAGLFSNASDLAGMMQMFLNKGQYGGVQYINSDVIDNYTRCQYCPKNRRGLGFDKPVTNRRGGPCSNLASMSSFGHSGFTGTLAWADPESKINYVFLSNRVYPDAENWKIVKMSTRTEIQRVVYEAFNSRKR